VLDVLVVIEHHSRRLVHLNDGAFDRMGMRRQLREAACEEQYAYLLHDRDAIFSAELVNPSSG
jgi:putative transposase